MAATDGMGARHPFYNSSMLPLAPAPLQRPQRIVRIRAIGPRRFMVAGRTVELGEEVDVPEYVAVDLVTTGKAEYA